MCPAFVDVEGGVYFLMRCDVSPDQPRKKLLLMILMKVSGVGEKTVP